MATYLLTWNPTKYRWEDVHEDYDDFRKRDLTEIGWSCGNTKRIQYGDRAFLMVLGHQQPLQGIMASGRFLGTPEEGGHWYDEAQSDTTLYVYFEPDMMLNPGTQPLLDPHPIPGDFNWHPQRSGVTIPPDVAERLEEAWRNHLAALKLKARPYKTRRKKTLLGRFSNLLQGRKSQPKATRAERNSADRKKCIEHHGAVCAVCRFDFEKVYGEFGKEYIEVHHIQPVAVADPSAAVDPSKDLVPLCSNCHKMIHHGNPPLSINELRRRMGIDS